MIPNQWYAIYESKSLRSDRPVGIKRLGEKLLLWRRPSGQVSCLPDRCSHRGSALSGGAIVGDCVECPFHGLLFGDDGRCRLIPTDGPGKPVPRRFHLQPFMVREKYDLVWLWYGEMRDHYPPIPWIEDRPVLNSESNQSSTHIREVPVHYARYVEASLDVHHVPVLHKSISQGSEKAVQECRAELRGDELDNACLMVWPGGKKTMELLVRLKFPNLLYLDFAERWHGMTIYTPIDEHNTWAFSRFAQSYVRVPLLGKAMVWAHLNFFYWPWVQDREDIPMMKAMQSPRPNPVDWNLCGADKGIALYFKERARLIEQARDCELWPGFTPRPRATLRRGAAIGGEA
ncbi:MAG: Rieske 2Fe-2S domain-containing protein [Myxococcota bacterium]